MNGYLRFNKKCKLALFLLLSVVGMTKADVPAGAINGIFSVSENTQVYFSQGNLQYQASTNTWRFAENQYNYIGNPNTNVSSTYSGWIDLFGWGTSGYHNSSDPYNTNYYPYSTSTFVVNSTYNRYGYGPSTNMTDPNLTNTSSGYDWGVHNSIINGGNTVDTWRILTQSEWNYVLNTRVTASGIRYAKARVNYVNGLILLPDNWSASTYSLSNTNSNEAFFNSNSISGTQWTILENAGAVFLPAAGLRYETSVELVGSYGFYWSASYENSLSAYSVFCGDDDIWINGCGRYNGLSVRLVRSTQDNLNYSYNESDYTATVIGHVDGTAATGELIIPSTTIYNGEIYTVTKIGGDAFNNCYGLTGSLTIPNTITEIEGRAFRNCNNLSGTLTLSNSLISIGERAFESCLGLSGDLVIPNSVTFIGEKAFRDCSGFQGTLIISNGMTYIDKSFERCGFTSVTIPTSVVQIWKNAFAGCSSLTRTDYLGTIEQWCNIGFGSNSNPVTYSHNLYINGIKVTDLVIPETVTAIKNYAFYGCNLSSVTLPNTIISIGDYAFYGCSNLVTLTVPNSVNSIGEYAFYQCDNLNSVYIGNSVGNIKTYAFSYCQNLGQITVDPDNTYFDSRNNCNAIIRKTDNYLVVGCKNTIIPSSVTTIGGYAFYGCSNLTSVTIPNSVTSIEGYAFYDCNGLISVSIGSSVNWIGYSAFYCHSLSNLTVLAENPPTIQSSTFASVSKDIPVYIPCNALETYQTAMYWSEFSNYQLLTCQFVITASANPTEGGIVIGADTYEEGSICTLIAMPNTGYTFTKWTKNGIQVSTDTNYTFMVTEAASFEAVFTVNSYAITATANPTAGGTVSGAATYNHSSTCTLTAMANEGYEFVNWTENGEEVSTDATYSFTVTGDRTLVANFSETPPDNHWTSITGTQYNLTMSGVIYIDGVAQTSTALEVGAFCGDECRGSARVQYFPPTDEYVVSLAVVSNQQSGETITFRLYDHDTQQEFPSECVNSITFVANANFGEMGNWYSFAFSNTVAIAATVTPEGAGEVEGTGDYLIGTSCTLIATANTGYAFVNWTENSSVVSADNPYTFTVNSAVELTANFSLSSYDITASANPAEGGTITGTGAYDHFSTCTLTATPNTGYAFHSWCVAGEVVSTDNPYTFTVSGGVEVTANFDAQETTALAEGWTWWSTSIELSGIDGLTMLEESLGHNGLMIKSANKFVQNYYPSTGYDYWFGQLTSDDFTNASSYMIQTSASCEVTMTGVYADPSDHPIQLYPGWTWIGYPCGSQQSAASAFAGFTPTANDKVKSQYAFSTYYDNYGWFPEFTMTPGEGYLYQSLASNTRTLTFANGSKDNPQPANEEDRYWGNNIHAYADNMNVIAVVTVNGEEQQGEDLELGAFVEGECRGSAVLKYFQPTDRWYAMLTVTGADGDQIDFGIIDKGKGLTSMTSDRSLAFQANAVLGELDEPYTIGFGTLGCVENNLMGAMHIYPNPIDRNTAFSIVVPETETVRSIYIVNMMGEVVAHETNLTRSLAIQAQGVYTIKVVCHSGNVYVGKLIMK